MSTDQQARPTPRRRRSPAAAVSVAAAVLLAGGGGAYWASTAGDGGGGAAAAPQGPPPPLVLSGFTDAGSGGADLGGASPAPADSGPAAIAPGEPDPHGNGTAGQVLYRAAGKLPDGPGSAPVHRAQGAVGADEVSRLAKALAVPGTARLNGGSWLVGALPDGSGAQLRVSERAPGTWTFARHPAAKGSTDCLRGKSCVQGTPVGEDAAKQAAAPVLRALGLDDAKLDAAQVLGGARVVNADPVVGGLPTYGWTTGIPVGPDGRVVGGSGQLKGLSKGAEYPVVSAGKALQLLNEAGRRAGGPKSGDCTGPVPAKGTELSVAPQEPGPERGEIAPCEPRRAPQRTVTVDSAVFGLATQYADGQQMLVPSWLFRVRPAGDEKPSTVTYPAVDPKFLVTPAPPKGDDPATDSSAGPTDGPATTPDRHVESYRTDGRKLSLTFWGGACSDYTAKAVEAGGTVEVRITENDPDPKRICIAVAKKLTQTVTLAEPVAGRTVVGADGKAVPKG